MSLETTAAPKNALLLGMVFSIEKDPLTGQMFRDRVRCEAMERLGFNVKTLDDKHDGDVERAASDPTSFSDDDKNYAKRGTHCRANFAQCRRMLKSMEDAWGVDQSFDQIILDYFFCPAGYVNMRWAEPFFRDTLPAIASKGIITKNGSIWLPHAAYVEEMLEKYGDVLAPYYQSKLVCRFNECPLYEATENVEDQLKMCPDRRTNSNQIEPLLAVSESIFFELKLRTEPMTPSTSGKAKRSKSSPVSPSKKSRVAAAKKDQTKLTMDLTHE